MCQACKKLDQGRALPEENMWFRAMFAAPAHLVDKLKIAAKDLDLRSSTTKTDVDRCTKGCRGSGPIYELDERDLGPYF